MVYSNYLDSKGKMGLRFTLLVSLILMLTACTDQVLYSNLTEREANEIVALLYNKGITAKKSSKGDATYSVSTQDKMFSQAIKILSSNGYPKNHFESLGDVFKKEGFVSSPLEERARLNYAQSQELARTIESIDGVVLARVHLAIPEDSDLNESKKPSSASVFLKHRRGIDLSGREAQIKALIVNSIEGLPYENVTVAMFSTNPIPEYVRQDSSELLNMSSSLLIYLIVCLSILVLLLGGVSLWLWLKNKKAVTKYDIAKSQT